MTESFLYYVWQFQRFATQRLLTVDGQAIQIEQTGFRNQDAGPDFFDARLRIGDTLWAGNVEMHLNTSDWNKHKHQIDKAYNNTILHVVFHHDEDVYTENGRKLACIALKDFIDPQFLSEYKNFMQEQKVINCEHHIKTIDTYIWQHWLHTLAIERLEAKTDHLNQLLAQTKHDWRAVLLIHIASYLGGKTNQLAFQILMRSMPSTVIIKHQHKLSQIEALLFGQAGFLESNVDDTYHKALQKEYQFLKAKYQLITMPPHLWKHLRMRPSAFPEIRIAQLAQILHSDEDLLSCILKTNNLQTVERYFDVSASSYWNNHYRFGKISTQQMDKKVGKHTRNSIIINAIIPFLFVYGVKQQKEELRTRALQFLESLAPEQNKVVKMFNCLGLKLSSALHSQAILQLKTHYCDAKRCLNCSVGHRILQTKH